MLRNVSTTDEGCTTDAAAAAAAAGETGKKKH